MNENKDLIHYRLARAHETLDEADILIKSGHASAFVNRLYYSCFYSVSALLLTRRLISAKHTGVRALFNQNFVKSGAVDQKFGKFYDILFRNRQKGDYGDFVHFELDEVRGWYVEAQEFIKVIEELINKELDRNDGSGSEDVARE